MLSPGAFGMVPAGSTSTVNSEGTGVGAIGPPASAVGRPKSRIAGRMAAISRRFFTADSLSAPDVPSELRVSLDRPYQRMSAAVRQNGRSSQKRPRIFPQRSSAPSTPSKPSQRWPSFSSERATGGSAAPTAAAPSTSSSASAPSRPTSPRQPSTPIIHNNSWAPTIAHRQPSICCTPWPRASWPESATAPRPEASTFAVSSRPCPATST